MAGPLHGLKVLDLSRVLAGPWAAQILADLGADVIKVERPGAGDDTRLWGPPFVTDADGTPGDAAYFLAANRNKRSLAVDLASADGQAVIRRLAAQADVVLENFKQGDLARYGLDYATLSAEHPKLIYCSITGFGQDGPHKHRPGYDFMIQGMAGFMSLTGEAGGEPLRAGVAVADLTTGMYSAIAILAALRHRDASGEGQHVDMALFDVTFGWLANQAQNYLVGGKAPGRVGNTHPNLVPYQVFPTATKPVIVAVGNDRQFAAFAAVLGHPEWAADSRFKLNRDRIANRDMLVALIIEALATQSADHWLAAIEAVGVPVGPVNDLAQAFADPQVAARGLLVEVAHPVAGRIPTVAQPMKFSKTAPEYRSAPPLIGQHSRAVLADAGFTEDEIVALESSGVVSQHP
ncbi:CaiB/BaiF CoA transferase family protein [Sphingoaurantiacus capsulatus]|uniref:CaiB/BaiF CoA transferase family protein n=1 Tax=Sphingoaurantiacus capsulatus TaxID=1771310 RepID=A0ABV7X6H5_9SPHN